MVVVSHIPDFADIKIKRQKTLGSKMIFPIKFGDDGGECVFQTPKMVIPHGPILFPEKDDIQFDCANEKFTKSLLAIEQQIIDRITETVWHVLENKEESSRVKELDFGHVLRLHVRNITNVMIFNQHAVPIAAHPNPICMNREIDVILHMRWVWVSSTHYGVDYDVLQIRATMPPRHFCFSENQNPFKKYERMKRIMMPSPVGTTQVMDTTSKAPSKSAAAPPTFLSQIAQGNFRLKKVHIDPEEEHKRRVLNKLTNYVNIDKPVPSLDAILDARQRLKPAGSSADT